MTRPRPAGEGSRERHRRSVRSGAEWEARYGYRRAVRLGDVVAVAGTTAPGRDAAAQARRAFQTALGALAELGGGPEHVVRTRMYVVDIARDGEAVGLAHAEAFREHAPAATMVGVAALIAPDRLVEVEIDAVVGPE